LNSTELVDVVDEAGRVIDTVTRAEMRHRVPSGPRRPSTRRRFVHSVTSDARNRSTSDPDLDSAQRGLLQRGYDVRDEIPNRVFIRRTSTEGADEQDAVARFEATERRVCFEGVPSTTT